MKYDVIDAFLAGLFSGPTRVFLGIATMAAMLAACVLVENVAPREWYETPMSWGASLFVFIVTILLYWNDLGGWIALGIFCFIGMTLEAGLPLVSSVLLANGAHFTLLSSPMILKHGGLSS